MDVKVSWKGKLAFDATAKSGFTLPLDARSAVGGDGSGFQPMELFALGLAGCTAMDVISILGKKGQQVSFFDVQVHVDRAAEHPKVFTRGRIEYLVSGRNLQEEALVRAIELSAVRYCPAQAMLGKIMPIELAYSIFEDQPGGERQLVKQGVYTVPTQAVL